jgi:DNA-binding transcriptional MerR regulator
MLVHELAKRVNRSPDTIKRWADTGLLDCTRDDRNRRQFAEDSIERCRDLARLSIRAQTENRKLADLLAELPQQVRLIP